MAGLCSIVPLQYVLLMLTSQKRLVKYLKPIYTDCMAKISIKHLFICSGYGIVPEWCTGYLTLNTPFKLDIILVST